MADSPSTSGEPGAFFENNTDPNYFDSGTVVTLYDNGTYSVANDRTGHSATYFGEASGDKVLEYTVGPHVESELFSIYGNQDAAILALTKGDIDYVFNPLGLEKGFLDPGSGILPTYRSPLTPTTVSDTSASTSGSHQWTSPSSDKPSPP